MKGEFGYKKNTRETGDEKRERGKNERHERASKTRNDKQRERREIQESLKT